MSRTDRVEIALGADPNALPGTYVWTDATSYAMARNQVRLQQGKLSEDGAVPPSTCEFLVDNTDGRWVARNPQGVWYGQIRRNIPIRALADVDSNVVDGLATFSVASAAGWPTLDTGQSWTHIALGGTISASDWSSSGGKGIQSVPTTSAYRLAITPGRPQLTDASVKLSVTCPVPTGGNLEPANIYMRSNSGATTYYMCRVQITTAAAVQVLIFRTGSTLVSATTVAGLTHSAVTALNVRAECYGSTVRMRVWQGGVEPVGTWHASVVDSAPIGDPGYCGVRSGVASGNTNSKPVLFSYDDVTIERPPVRFAGFIDELPVRWDTPTFSFVQLSASGYLRRINQNDSPIRSAMYRTRTSPGHEQPREYWPMEDPSGSSQFASAVGGKAMSVTDQSLAASSAFPGSAPLPTFGALPMYGTVRGLDTAPTEYGLRFLFVAPQLPSSSIGFLDLTSPAGTVRMAYFTGGDLGLQIFDTSGTELIGAPGRLTTFDDFYMTHPCQIFVNLTQNGANIDWSFQISAINVGTNTLTGSVAGTVTWPSRFRITPGVGAPAGAFVMGHLALYTDTGASPSSAAYNGWAGLSAVNRIQGLCDDADIPCSTVDLTDYVTLVGYQATSTLPALLQDAADADGGILHEREFGLMYLARYELYNRTVDMTVDYQLGHLKLFEPVDDDQGRVNDMTVAKTGGSSFRAKDDADIALYGRSDDSKSLNLYNDPDAELQAWWRLGLGTVDDLRYPTIQIDLNARRDLVTAWKKCTVGSRIQITRPPNGLGGQTIDLLLLGWTETLDEGDGTWIVNLNCVSYLPWIIFQLEAGGDLGKATCGFSTLTSSITASTTSVSITTATGHPAWQTGATSTNLICDGEVMTVTNVAGASTPQTLTVARGQGGTTARAHSAGVGIDIYRPGKVGL